MLSHWCACIYGSLVDWEYGEDLSEKYLASFYWAVQSLTTVGYGDLQPDTEDGKIVSIMVMLIGRCVPKRCIGQHLVFPGGRHAKRKDLTMKLQ